ncbi:MAG: heavy metal transport/detoxification protein [uncultured bacterium]|nr:MAG: heavy metal transport/detoxification protein [uncultured bacterium]
MTQTEFFVHGMHCPACEIYIEDTLAKKEGIIKVKANLKTSKVCIESNIPLSSEGLSKLVESQGYKISVEQEKEKRIELKQLGIGFVIAGLIFGAFLLMQKLGLVNLINPQQVTLPFVFFIGIVASLSTCMAVVGGLVLSISSSFAKTKNLAPLIAFHISRLVGFFILGGLIGLIGSAFSLNNVAYFVLDTVLFVVMALMGLNLLEVFTFTKKAQIVMPKFLSEKIFRLKNNILTEPSKTKSILFTVLMGAGTFVLPCGFTQAMQLYSLTSGNFVQGALTMFVFALGTLPILGLISFISVKFRSKLFFTTAGFLVLMFAVFNFLSGLAALGFGI